MLSPLLPLQAFFLPSCLMGKNNVFPLFFSFDGNGWWVSVFSSFLILPKFRSLLDLLCLVFMAFTSLLILYQVPFCSLAPLGLWLVSIEFSSLPFSPINRAKRDMELVLCFCFQPLPHFALKHWPLFYKRLLIPLWLSYFTCPCKFGPYSLILALWIWYWGWRLNSKVTWLHRILRVFSHWLVKDIWRKGELKNEILNGCLIKT